MHGKQTEQQAVDSKEGGIEAESLREAKNSKCSEDSCSSRTVLFNLFRGDDEEIDRKRVMMKCDQMNQS